MSRQNAVNASVNDISGDAAPADLNNPDADRLGFKPFFTLISSSSPQSIQAYHHPHTHYIFNDDDPELFTSALLHSLRTSSAQHSADNSPSSDERGPKGVAQARLTPDERLLLIDLAADGASVTSARSLSSDWMLQQASISAAPTFGGAHQTSGEEGEAGLMLKIEGVESVADHNELAEAISAVNATTEGELKARLQTLETRYMKGLGKLRKMAEYMGDTG